MFLSNKYSGVDFRERKIAFATMKLDKDLPMVLSLTTIDSNHKIIDSGRLTHSETTTSDLRKILSNKDVSKLLHIAIPTQFTLVRKINSLPDLGEVELSRLLQFQIGESIHLPFEEPVYDFVKIGSIQPEKTKDEDLESLAGATEANLKGPRSEILFFATSKSLAEDLSNACQNAGFKPKSAEIRGLALQRLLMYAQPNWLTGTEMVVDVSDESIDLHIFKDELIIFTRTMPIDRSQYYRTFTSPVSEDNFEATSLVLETTLSLQEVDFEDVAATTDAAKRVSGGTTDITNLSYDEASYLSDLVNEIERAQNFFRYSLDQRDSEFKRIIITGEGTERVLSELKERMNTEVCRIDYSAIIPPDFNQLELLDTCSVAIGLAMRANEKNERNKKN